MADDSLADANVGVGLPAYALSRFVTRDAQTDALTLCDKSDFLLSRTNDGVCLALFTSPQAAESYREGRNLATGYAVMPLDSLDLLCVLSRMGAACESVAVDMGPRTNGGRVVAVESMRQTLATHQRDPREAASSP